MAYDPEARQTGNNAMIASIVALVLIVGAVLAYYATRHDNTDTDTSTPVIVQHNNPVPVGNTTIVNPAVTVPVPVTNAAPVVIDRRPVVVQGNTKTIVRDSKTTTTRVVPAPQTGTNSGGASSGSGASGASPNITINNNPSASSGTAPRATPSSGSSSGASGGTSGATSNSASSGTGTGTSSSDLPPPAPATP